MKHWYANRQGRREVARVTLDWEPSMADDFAFIANVFTAPGWRGRGLATALLKRACADADREGVELQLYPAPLEVGGLTLGELRAWYGRHGFSAEGMAGGYLRRLPRGVM